VQRCGLAADWLPAWRRILTPTVSLEGIRHSFGGAPVLDGISFSVHPGEVLGIVGPGGCGKSLLLKIIAGLVRPQEGSVHVLGEDILALESLDMVHVRSKMGMLFQNYALFDFLTVGENAGFPLLQAPENKGKDKKKMVMGRVSELLKKLGLGGTERLYPNELSGGMRKRVGLARATIHEPELILYDDPSAGLDPVTSSKIFGLIDAIHDATASTEIIVSHDVDRMHAVCDRFLLLHKGNIHFEGTLKEAEEHRDDPVVHAFFFREQASSEPTGMASPPPVPQ